MFHVLMRQTRLSSVHSRHRDRWWQRRSSATNVVQHRRY